MSDASVDQLPGYGACVWGFNSPGGFLWARVFPNGRLYIQAEAKFFQLPVEDAAAIIHRTTNDLNLRRLRSIYCAPEMVQKEVDERDRSIRVEAIADTFRRYRVTMIPSDPDEFNGWQRVHDYLRPAPDGQPWLVISPDCQQLVRALPTLAQHEKRPDETETTDWSAHALRLLIAARPHPSVLANRKLPFEPMTLGWLKERDKAHAPTGPLRRR